VTVRLYQYEDGEWTFVDERTTDADGEFDFGEVPVGDLEVRIVPETVPEGYTIDEYYHRLTTTPGGEYEEHFQVDAEDDDTEIPPVPPTGENNAIFFAVMLMIMAIGILVLLAVKKKSIA